MVETDVIVVGIGTCGEDIALRLLASGLDVVGIEARLIGGECPYFACLPTKAMVRSANLVQESRRADGFVGHVDVRPDWSVVARRVRDEVTGGWDDTNAVTRFRDRGGHFVRGRGRLTGPRTVSVGEDAFTARRGIVVATGSRPWMPPVPGLADLDAWTTQDAVRQDRLPDPLLVLGGGAVGCEFSQVFARFGVDVTILEAGDRVLPNEEPEVAEVLGEALARDGVTVRCGDEVVEFTRREGMVRAAFGEGHLDAQQVLVATGRRVDLSGLGVEDAGLEVTDGAILVDDHLRAAEGIWAVGDVTGMGMFTHVALHQASIAVAGILGDHPPAADYRAVPRVTFTDPEVASVGLTEAAARSAGIDVRVVVKSLQATFRGWLHGPGGTGLVKLVADRGADRLVGATVVGPRAGETLGILTLAIHAGIPLHDLVTMIYPFPTFLGGIGEALGAQGRGLVTVLDPGNEPMFTD